MRKHQNISALTGCGIVLLLVFQIGMNAEKDPPGELSLSHSHLKQGSCTACHSGPGEISAAKCFVCHDAVADRIKQKRGYHSDKEGDCGTCHGEHRGKNSRLVELDEKDFDHAETGFELKGNHRDIKNCRTCHSPERLIKREQYCGYLLRTGSCIGCHSSPHPGIKVNCRSCHNESSWVIDNWSM